MGGSPTATYLCACWVTLQAFNRLLMIKRFLSSKYYFRKNISVSNILEPDQARRIVGPDLGPKCLQRLSADDKIDTSRQRVEINETCIWFV